MEKAYFNFDFGVPPKGMLKSNDIFRKQIFTKISQNIKPNKKSIELFEYNDSGMCLYIPEEGIISALEKTIEYFESIQEFMECSRLLNIKNGYETKRSRVCSK